MSTKRKKEQNPTAEKAANASSSSSSSSSSSVSNGGANKKPKKQLRLSEVPIGVGVENPIMVALGATPRGSLVTESVWRTDGDVLASRSGPIAETATVVVAPQLPPSYGEISKSERRQKNETQAATTHSNHEERHDFLTGTSTLEVGDDHVISIDPTDRSVEHHVPKSVRREIKIASPAGQEDDEWDSYSPPQQSPSPKLSEDLHNMALVSARWRELTNMVALCRGLRNTTSDGSVNWLNFQNLGIKNKGTEGTCFKCRQRSTGKILALKRARVFPKGEGVPYYMLRELAVLQGVQHKNIASLEMASLAKDELHVFFPYVDKTLHEIINPTNHPGGGVDTLAEHQTRRLLHQLLDAIAYCHRRGVLHRNLKPKHLLIAVSDAGLDHATLQVSDFALVRATGLPRRVYTTEVVTLWYRPPEILMGLRGYSPAVDIWSIGCIFAEMIQGKPLFTGISEIDQLFQIFSKLSTPTDQDWPEFRRLPNFHFEFPNWTLRPLSRLFPKLSAAGLDLMTKLLTYNPDKRITAEEALRHPYFASSSSPFFQEMLPSIPMKNMRFGIAKRASSGPSEYVRLYHEFLRDSEVKLCRNINYLSRQKALRPMHRAMLVDWLIEVVDVFEMCLRTAFLAVNYTDRFLDTVMVKKNKFQLLGATCLHVASKCEDVSYIGVDDLAMCADNVYTSMEVLKMEEKLLNTLDFALSVPTSLDFLHVFDELMPPMLGKTQAFAQYLAELALQEYQFLKYLPSLVATCCISLAMYCVEQTSWNSELEKASHYKWADLKDCMLELQAMYSGSTFTVLAVVKKRYSKTERYQVANIRPPTRYTMVW